METSGGSLSDLDCEPLVGTPLGCVAIQKSVKKEFDALPEDVRCRFIRIMQLWTDKMALTQEQFNGNEGRAQRGDLNVMVQAFKAFKVRLYGFVTEVGDRRSFLITALDPAKKQNKADPRILSRAQGRCLDLLEKKKSAKLKSSGNKKNSKG